MIKFVSALAVAVLSVTSMFAQGAVESRESSRARVIASSELSGNRTEVSLTNSSSVRSVNKSAPKNEALRSTGASPDYVGATTTPGTRPRTNAVTSGTVSTPPAAENQIYRVGVGDVLDVRLVGMPTAKSSLFTVLDSGMLDYPLSNSPVAVAGLTADEIAAKLSARIKVLDNPKVVVKIRDYSSHNVIVTGFVFDPGARSLRREATPFYVVLAEAQPRPEAITATILRTGVPAIKIDLKDQNSVGTMVMAGDVIKVSGTPAEPTAYFFAGGALNSPGQKAFHNGLTLTQAILASGGVTRTAGGKVSVSRQGPDGRLVTTEYNLQKIQEGKTPDPVLLRGDRISIAEGR